MGGSLGLEDGAREWDAGAVPPGRSSGLRALGVGGGYLQLLPGSSRERELRVLRVATELRPAALGPLEAC